MHSSFRRHHHSIFDKKHTDHYSSLQINLIEKNDRAIFRFHGPKTEVSQRFQQLLQLVKMDYYQIEDNLLAAHPENGFIQIAFRLNQADDLAKMFWYLNQTVPHFNEKKLLEAFPVSDNNNLVTPGSIFSDAAKKARDVLSGNKLPAYIPSHQEQLAEKTKHQHSHHFRKK